MQLSWITELWGLQTLYTCSPKFQTHLQVFAPCPSGESAPPLGKHFLSVMNLLQPKQTWPQRWAVSYHPSADRQSPTVSQAAAGLRQVPPLDVWPLLGTAPVPVSGIQTPRLKKSLQTVTSFKDHVVMSKIIKHYYSPIVTV